MADNGQRNGEEEHALVAEPLSFEPEDVVVPASNRMIAACTGSLLTSLLVTPLDVVRVRLQSQAPTSAKTLIPPPDKFSKLPPNLGVTACCREVFFHSPTATTCLVAPNTVSTLDSLTHCAADEIQSRNFTSTYDALRKIARYEGITSLWRGLSPTLLMAIPANVIYFTGYDSMRYSRHSPLRQHLNDTTAPLVAGSFARIISAAAVGPLEMFRTRLQATSASSSLAEKRRGGQFASTLRGMGELVRDQGYSSMWRGLGLTLWRDVPFSGLYWYGYETLKNRISLLAARTSSSKESSAKLHTHTSAFMVSFVSGFLSGGAASIITQPFDVGKTRQQVFAHSEHGSGSAVANSLSKFGQKEHLTKVLVDIWRDEGARGLWRGVTARTLKVAPACAIMISSYEIGKRVAAQGMINDKREADAAENAI